MKDALYREDMKTRREILGEGRVEAVVQKEDDFSMPLREFTTRYVWGELGSRKGWKTREMKVRTVRFAE